MSVRVNGSPQMGCRRCNEQRGTGRYFCDGCRKDGGGPEVPMGASIWLHTATDTIGPLTPLYDSGHDRLLFGIVPFTGDRYTLDYFAELGWTWEIVEADS